MDADNLKDLKTLLELYDKKHELVLEKKKELEDANKAQSDIVKEIATKIGYPGKKAFIRNGVKISIVFRKDTGTYFFRGASENPDDIIV